MRRAGIWLTILGVLLVLAASLFAWKQTLFIISPVSQTSKQVQVNIPPGSSAAEIGRRLENAGVIRSAVAFNLLVAWQEDEARLRAGEHLLDPSMSIKNIIDHIIRGQMKMYKVTIPEGLNLKQTAQVLADAGLADTAEFIKLFEDQSILNRVAPDAKNLEGYLFPETYFFTAGTTGREIVYSIIERFNLVWARYSDLAEDKNMSRQTVVTLASIVEKETGAKVERPLIAAVFLNRLKRKMRLQSDPTVIYGLSNFNGNLTRRHLETYNPYNTYVIKGLPPGPIANPGEDSIKAVLEPASVSYLYFVAKNDGTHYFSKTLSEHIRAVNKYQRRRRRANR